MSENPNGNCCGGTVMVDCCPNPVPKRLRADFSQGCAFNGPITLEWTEEYQWIAEHVGCGDQEVVQLTCEGTDVNGFKLYILGASGCVYDISLRSGASCDGFRLVYDITQVGMAPGSCPCCSNGTSFQVTIEPED